MNPDPKRCPPLMVEQFINYRDNGVPPGDFVRACLENNLIQAFLRADDENREAMQDIVAWLYWEMPMNLWKSPEAVNAHLSRKQQERDARSMQAAAILVEHRPLSEFQTDD